MLLPLFHDKMTVRRWPWVTTLVVLATVALHALVTPVQTEAELRRQLLEGWTA